MESTTDTELKNLLLARIAKAGRLTFADFMAACLYEPGLGYYTSPGRKVGAEGDFYTSMNVHLMFGRLITREICRMWELLGSPADFAIVEAGAGGGQLAADILETIAEINRPFYDVLTYRLVEKEPTLKAAQQEKLAGHLSRLAWSSPEELADGSLHFTGCLLSNELIDAMPVHLVEMTPAGLMEVYVTAIDGEFGEMLDEPSTPALAEYLKESDVALLAGQRAEINLAALDWLQSVANALDRGFIMTIDYGYEADELYAPVRKNGTLLCYYQHTTCEDPYTRVGKQDITSHVNFTALIKEGERWGLRKAWLGEQYRFLLGAGLMEEMLALETSGATETELLKTRLALKKLMLPDGGMGDTFRVLIQAKGVEDPQLLCMRDWGKL
ncbi:SAM-dependent methyltransferase [Geotalea sp. SG265]|uniref:class I SAM-dependent methyltransferase n=1 Tax=Geotalea sp. SG265 TaxID=2922867 RepID=UPI001FAEA148|nr:SAM-dependent methyltransferase [Geotalea sp. SG265]